QAGIPQHLQMLRDGRLRQLERVDDVADRAFVAGEELEDVAPPWFGDGVEGVGGRRGAGHASFIHSDMGMCQAGRLRAFFLVFSTALRQASVSASPSVSSSTSASSTAVHPWRPHAPFSGLNAPRCSVTNLCCCSGVSLTMPEAPSPCSVAKMRPLTRKS